MNRNLGSKNGKNNRRLFNLNQKRKKKIEEQKLTQKEKNNSKKIEDKKKLIIINQSLNKNRIIDINLNNNNDTDKIIEKQQEKIITDDKNKTVFINKQSKVKKVKNKKKDNYENNNQTQTENKIKQEKNTNLTHDNIKDTDYLEKQIIKILEQQIDENNYQLKKLDSELHTIKREIDDLKEKEEVEETIKEIQLLIDKLKQIKRQIISLQQTFEFDYPIDEPDNYLIYLVDEFKEKRKIDKELEEKLKQHLEYKNIVDRIIEIEEKQEELLEHVSDKKTSLDIDNNKIKKMNDDIVDIEDMRKRIDKMLENQNNLLEEIKIRVNETVHITEKVDYISKTVKHSMLDLFLLMSILKHNLSIKNNIVAAVSAKLALDLIIKMTTPTEEKIIIKANDVKDYNNLINDCLNDTKKLVSLMDENLNSISSIRYTFENDYKECSYLPSYQEITNKIINLEDEMKERKIEVLKIKKETELQLEKNNAKVKKYNSMEI